MFVTRRHILVLAGSPLFAKVFHEPFDVDRILQAGAGPESVVRSRRYVANATITLFSIPLGTKNGVGSGYTVIEEASGSAGKTVSIQFGAGSWPENARGLNRLGFIQEAAFEPQSGAGSGTQECAYLAFMTTSQEKSLDQAKKALVTSSDSVTGSMVPYSAAQGCGKRGRFASRVDRLQFPARYTWRDVQLLLGKARGEMAANGIPHDHAGDDRAGDDHANTAGAETPATFLYAVRKALLDPRPKTTAGLFFNSKQFQLDTEKVADATAGAHFAGRNLVTRAESVMRLNALLTERRTGEKTPFHLWYEAGEEHMPPLRFEYQARSFLRLTFEVDAAASVPPVRFALTAAKEDA